MLIEGLPLWLAQTNCWLIAPHGPGGEAILVDAPPDPKAIVQRLHHHDLRLVAILNTHGHVDHVGGVGELVHGPETPDDIAVWIHELDRHMLLDPKGTSGMFGRYLDDLDTRPPEVIHDIDDGQVIRAGALTFTALHTPGHTMGSTCFTLEVAGHAPVLFSGDHLFRGSIGRTDLPGGSFEALMASMADKILPLADETQVLPGHGPVTSVGLERRTNPFILELLAERRNR